MTGTGFMMFFVGIFFAFIQGENASDNSKSFWGWMIIIGFCFMVIGAGMWLGTVMP